jgi:hypothetical protein
MSSQGAKSYADICTEAVGLNVQYQMLVPFSQAGSIIDNNLLDLTSIKISTEKLCYPHTTV